MTTEEQDQEIVWVVRKHQEVKKRLACLSAKKDRLLGNATAIMRGFDSKETMVQSSSGRTMDGLFAIEMERIPWPEPIEMTQLFLDLVSAKAEIQKLEDRKRELEIS